MEFRDFVTQRLESMRYHGPMYGTPEEIEGLSLQMLELEVLHYHPEALEKKPRIVSTAYRGELAKRTGISIFGLADPRRKPIENLAEALFDLFQTTRQHVQQEIDTGVPVSKFPG